MKCAKIQIVLEITVPYDDSSNESIEFDVNENRCIGTGNPGLFIEMIQVWGEENSFCWGCSIQKSMKLLEIVDLTKEETERDHPWLTWREDHSKEVKR